MNTFDASHDMDQAQQRRWENTETNAARRDSLRAAQDEKAQINKRFAELYDGDLDATATRVVEELGVSLYRVENAGAFDDAYQNDDKEDLLKMWA